MNLHQFIEIVWMGTTLYLICISCDILKCIIPKRIFWIYVCVHSVSESMCARDENAIGPLPDEARRGGKSSWRGRRWTFWRNLIISRKMKWKGGTIWRRKTMFQPFEKRRQSELTESDFLPTDEEASESFAKYCQNYLFEFTGYLAVGR